MSGAAADPSASPPLLLVLSGLPGAGKTALARALAPRLNAVHIRIDTIEQALLAVHGAALGGDVGEAGYRIAYALAADQLQLGHHVIADSVNPLAATREAWHAVARNAAAQVVDVEVVCSQPAEHRERVEARGADIAGQLLPNWQAVQSREYEPWPAGSCLRVDTAARSVEQAAAELLALLPASHRGTY